MPTKFHLLRKFALVGVILGFINYLIVTSLHNYYLRINDCIAQGEPFLMCGPDLIRIYYFFFYNDLPQLYIFLTNILIFSILSVPVGFLYKRFR